MYNLLYTSCAQPEVDRDALYDILGTAIQFNAKNSITGVLLYRKNTFMQLLEGDKSAIHALYEQITRDPRHSNCQVVLEKEVQERNLSTWSMGFFLLDGKFNHVYVEFISRLANQSFQHDTKMFHKKLLDFAMQQ